MQGDVEFGRFRSTLAAARRLQRLGYQAAGLALFEEFAAEFREHGVGQHVFLAVRQFADLAPQAIHLVVEQVGGADVDHVLVADGQLPDHGVDRPRRAAVTALQVQLDLIADGLVTLAGEHVEHRLGSDDLRGGCDQRRVAKVFAHARDFLKHFLDAVQ